MMNNLKVKTILTTANVLLSIWIKIDAIRKRRKNERLSKQINKKL